MGVIEHALDALPKEHSELWVAARAAVLRRVSVLWAMGIEPAEILVVVADRGTPVGEIVAELLESTAQPTVLVVWGAYRRRLLPLWPSLEGYLGPNHRDDLTLVTAPSGSDPGVSTCRVVDRRKLS